MPIYEFTCASCGSFDLKLPVDRAVQQTFCPSCAAPAARVFSSIQMRRSLAPWQAARERDRIRIKHATSGEPRIEKRAPERESSTSGWKPLHGTYGPTHH